MIYDLYVYNISLVLSVIYDMYVYTASLVLHCYNLSVLDKFSKLVLNVFMTVCLI